MRPVCCFTTASNAATAAPFSGAKKPLVPVRNSTSYMAFGSPTPSITFFSSLKASFTFSLGSRRRSISTVQAEGTTLVLWPPWNMPMFTVDFMAPDTRVRSALS